MCIEVFGVTSHQCYDEKAKEEKLEKEITLKDHHAQSIGRWVQKEKIKGVMNEYGITSDIIKLRKGKSIKFDTTRFLLQFVGTEILRDIVHPDYHAIVTFNKIERNGWDKVAIADSRFKNEREFVTKRKGHNVLIIGPKTEIKDGHRSENSLGVPEEYDWCIYNHKRWGLKQLENDVTTMYRTLSGLM